MMLLVSSETFSLFILKLFPLDFAFGRMAALSGLVGIPRPWALRT